VCFNPRAPAGRDVSRRHLLPHHVPFQSTRPCGARRPPYTVISGVDGFQSTRPCGARQTRVMIGQASSPRFNPRAPAGRDVLAMKGSTEPRGFQSTRPCGARPGKTTSLKCWQWFQSTRPCGARQALVSPAR